MKIDRVEIKRPDFRKNLSPEYNFSLFNLCVGKGCRFFSNSPHRARNSGAGVGKCKISGKLVEVFTNSSICPKTS